MEEVMYCLKCLEPLGTDFVFCSKCGSPPATADEYRAEMQYREAMDGAGKLIWYAAVFIAILLPLIILFLYSISPDQENFFNSLF